MGINLNALSGLGDLLVEGMRVRQLGPGYREKQQLLEQQVADAKARSAREAARDPIELQILQERLAQEQTRGRKGEADLQKLEEQLEREQKVRDFYAEMGLDPEKMAAEDTVATREFTGKKRKLELAQDAASIEAARALAKQRGTMMGGGWTWATPPGGQEAVRVPNSVAYSGGYGQAPTADERNKATARTLVQDSISAIEDLSTGLITKVGPQQRALAAVRGIESVLGNDPEYRTYQDARMALAGNLAVAQQGSRPSDADIQAIWLPLVPDVFKDTSESAKMKWALIRTMSHAAQEPKSGARPIEGVGVPGVDGNADNPAVTPTKKKITRIR